MKNSINEINTLKGINSKLEDAEKQINSLEDSIMENNQAKEYMGKKFKKWEQAEWTQQHHQVYNICNTEVKEKYTQIKNKRKIFHSFKLRKILSTEDLDQIEYTLFSYLAVCVKILGADGTSQGPHFPLIVPAAPSLQERLALSYLFASDCISTKKLC